MAVEGTGSQTSALHLLFKKKLLETFEPLRMLDQLGEQTQLPKGMGKQVKWRLFNRIAGNTIPLTEGTNPAESAYVSSNITADVSQYGDYVKVSDLLEAVSYHDEIGELMERHGEAAADVVDLLIIAELDATLTELFASKAANEDAITAEKIVVMKDFLRAMADLKANFVRPHRIGQYAVVLHPSTEFDIRTETNIGSWIDISLAPGVDKKKDLMTGEIGRAFGARFMFDNNMTSLNNAGGVPVKSNYVIGRECFGTVNLSGGRGGSAWEVIVKPSTSGGPSNPLNMFGTVGYKLKGYVVKNFAAGRGRRVRGASSL